jgi:Tol biopolymer transport system component
VTKPTGEVDDGEPSWSPDGRRIAFETLDGIYVVSVDGSDKRLIAEGRESPAWSPRGGKIAFSGPNPHERRCPHYWQIWVMNLNQGAGAPRPLTHGCYDYDNPAWAPQGRRLVFVGARVDKAFDQLWVVNANGKGLRRLTSDHHDHAWPTWSPDGKRIAFTRGPNIGESGPLNLFVINADGTRQRKLTHSGDDSEPDWSPR